MPDKTEIRSIMREFTFSVDYNDTLRKAENLMKRENIRNVPVVHDRKYVGMITERKILEYSLKRLYDYDKHDIESDELLISDFRNILLLDLPLVFPEDSINKAVEKMVKKKVDVLPVVDWHKNLVGIITSNDLLLFFHKMLKEGI
jgi:predicted transcriptional regulator